MPVPSRPMSVRSLAVVTFIVLSLVASVAAAGRLPVSRVVAADAVPNHLVISEVVTGGANASDELIELYNPSQATLPLEGLEVVYVTASGATISRRAAWELGSATISPGRHVLIANELGAYAAIADVTFASGMAATGGSVALRIQGAVTAIDAVGWGTAASTWIEGTPAAAPAAGSSLERLPGGAAGSTRDTDSNSADFAVRDVPDPQNSTSSAVPPPGPSGSPSASAMPTVSPTPTPGATASTTTSALPSPTPSTPPGPSMSVADARALADGGIATIEVTALTGSTFSEGGGYVADASAGMAVIVEGGAFARGDRLRLTGEVDDRFSQRTLRVHADDVTSLGTGADGQPLVVTTGQIAEGVEARLVRISGSILGSGTTLTSGVAFDVDDGSGPVRVLVGSGTGIDVAAWRSGTTLALIGVVGQRDSGGSGVAGYRVQPRATSDVLSATPPGSPSPTPASSDDPGPSPVPSPGVGVVSIADARAAAKNARVRVRGVVTFPTGVVDGQTAIIQDSSGAIVLRTGDDVGELRIGSLLEVDGTRSTKSGMETMRVTVAPRALGSAAEPAATARRTGDIGEAHEATLVTVRGALPANARRSSSGSVSFDLDDGSGELRVVIGSALGYDHGALVAGTWVEVRGAVGQDTTGAQPMRGYRVWPRGSGDVRVLAAPTGAQRQGAEGPGSEPGESTTSGAGDGGGAAANGLDALDATDPNLRIGATLVTGPWPEVGTAGLLWDGARLVAIEPRAADRVEDLLIGRGVPVALELTGLRDTGRTTNGIPIVTLGGANSVVIGASAPTAPSVDLPRSSDDARWVSLVGRLVPGDTPRLATRGGASVVVDRRCDGDPPLPAATVGIVGFATGDRPGALVAPCGAVRLAPALGRSAVGSDPVADTRPESEPTRAPASSASPTAGLAAGLLSAAALTVLAAVIVARRRGDEPPEDGPETEEAAGVDIDEHAGPPTLSLVSVPPRAAP